MRPADRLAAAQRLELEAVEREVARETLPAGIAHKRGKNRVGSREIGVLREGLLAMNLPANDAEIMSFRQFAGAMWQGAQVLAFRDCFYVTAVAVAALFLVIPLIPARRAPAKIW